MFRSASFLAILGLLLALPLSARASVVLQYDFDQLVAEADAIVHGRVVDQQASWQEQTIITRVELEVLRCPKGGYAVGDHLIVEQAGGVVGDLAMAVPGEATFATGEEVVVFLEVNPEAGAPLVLGMSQGKFTVTADPVAGSLMVTRAVEGMALVTPEGGLRTPPLDLPASELPEGVTLSAQIRAQVLDGPVRVPLEDFMGEIDRTLSREESY